MLHLVSGLPNVGRNTFFKSICNMPKDYKVLSRPNVLGPLVICCNAVKMQFLDKVREDSIANLHSAVDRDDSLDGQGKAMTLEFYLEVHNRSPDLYSKYLLDRIVKINGQVVVTDFGYMHELDYIKSNLMRKINTIRVHRDMGAHCRSNLDGYAHDYLVVPMEGHEKHIISACKANRDYLCYDYSESIVIDTQEHLTL